MLIEQKETRVLILPKILRSNYQGVNFKKTRKLLPGMNEIDDTYWAEAKKHFTIKEKLKNGLIVEYVKANKENKVIESEIEKLQEIIVEKKKKIEGNKKQIWKEKDKEKKQVLKEENNLLNDEIKEVENELTDKEILVSISSSNFQALSHEDKEKVIKETFDIETLENWKAKDTKAEVRNLILDQIAKIKESKVNVNIGKPKNSI